MYVSVTAGSGMGGDFLLHVRSDEIHSGTAVVPWDSEKQDGDRLGDNDLGALLWEELDFAGDFWHTLHVLEIDLEQFVYQDVKMEGGEEISSKEFLIVKYAWWWDDRGLGGAIGVVTTRNIFILGENGKTVARVR